MPKYCKDCRWFLIRTDHEPRCLSPKSNRKLNLVTGETETRFCEIERMDTSGKNTCGREGKYWEAIA